MIRRVLGLIVFVVVLVGVTAALVRLGERSMAFFPFRGEAETPAQYGIDFTPLDIPTPDDERLRAWWLPADRPRAQVIYFHGNGGNLSLWCPIIVGVRRQELSLLAVDYRGYGMSTGSPSERGLYRDVDATLERFYRELRREDTPVVYWGRSLGATMAAYAAARRAPDGLVLEAGFPSARAVLRGNPLLMVMGLFSSYRFATAEWLQSVERPVLVIHGTADRIIPFALGRELFGGIRGAKRFHAIEGGDHNDAQPLEAAAYWEAVRQFVADLEVRRTGR
jgi:fermentation-respiration switch protein FrsA (DUF1100 family)